MNVGSSLVKASKQAEKKNRKKAEKKRKSTILVNDIGNGGGHVCVEAGEIWEISVPFSIFL